MKERVAYAAIPQIQPAIAKSLIGLSQAAAVSFDKKLVHLVKLRASQINGCAFCLHLHTNEARAEGESQTRLDLLSAWREVPIFNNRERAALSWTESLTVIAGKGVSDTEFAIVAAEFNQEEIVNLTAIITTINSWNRISVGLGFIPKLD